MRRSISLAMLAAATLVGSCSPQRAAVARRDPDVLEGDSLVQAGDTLIWTGERSRFDEPGGVMIGRPPTGPGDGWTVPVGREFGVREAEDVYRRLVALDASNAFARFSCPGDSVPHFTFSMVLKGAGEYSERLVYFGSRPELGYWGPQRCQSLGMSYLVARTFAEVDSGPSEHYGYTNPQSGKELADWTAAQRHERSIPVCRCALRETDENWATYGPHESTVGAAAARP